MADQSADVSARQRQTEQIRVVPKRLKMVAGLRRYSSTPLGHLPGEVFGPRPSGRRPRTRWRDVPAGLGGGSGLA